MVHNRPADRIYAAGLTHEVELQKDFFLNKIVFLKGVHLVHGISYLFSLEIDIHPFTFGGSYG